MLVRNVCACLVYVRRQERLELGEAVALIEAVKSIFREENNMVGLQAPVSKGLTVYGEREHQFLNLAFFFCTSWQVTHWFI